jgi:hypothetical protein
LFAGIPGSRIYSFVKKWAAIFTIIQNLSLQKKKLNREK